MKTDSTDRRPSGDGSLSALASCPPDEPNCSCGRTRYQVIGGVARPVENQCTDGCVEPEGKILMTSEQMRVLELMEGCFFWRCCVRPHSGHA